MSFCTNAHFLRIAIVAASDCYSKIKEGSTLNMFFNSKRPQ